MFRTIRFLVPARTNAMKCCAVLVLFLTVLLTPSPAAAQCSFQILRPTLALTSFDGTFFFLDSGTILAASTQNFCVFVADNPVMGPSLGAFRTVPLGTVLDEWFVFDNGSLLPLLRFFRGGSIQFVALNVTDGTLSVGVGFVTLAVIPI